MTLQPEQRGDEPSARSVAGSRRVTILDFHDYHPWDVELSTAAEFGLDVEIVEYEQFRVDPSPCDVLVNSWGYPLPRDLLERIEGCSLIVGFGTGTDYIDLPTARELGIDVANQPGLNVEDVATHSLALMLACARRIIDYDTTVRSGQFYGGVDARSCQRLLGKTLGLLAFGRIPRRLREMVRPFDMRVLAYDPNVPAEEMAAVQVECVGLEELLRSSEILSVHTPDTPETRGLLSEQRLRLLPAGAIFLAMGRGSVYDPYALAAALRESRIAAAGIDVFSEEPAPLSHPLLSAPRTVLTPHCAGDSADALRAHHRATAEALAAWARGDRPPNVVN